jgi:hypothetical protein
MSLDKLIDLFKGYENAHGRYEIRRVSEKGKAEGQARTITSAGATEDDWKGHLTGNGPGIGIIPLLMNNCVRWGCIDVDVYPLDHAKLEKDINAKSLPLVMCRSKSGGAHLFIFFVEETPANEAQAILAEWAALLGYGGSEIFPKQTSRANEKDIGNWLNMPYFKTSDTNRYCFRDGQPLALAAFLKYAKQKSINLAEWEKTGGMEDEGGLFDEAPPCLQHIRNAGGFGEGGRNDGMFSVGVYLRKRFPDDWKDKLQVYAVEMCDPVLPHNELTNLIKSLGKKDYEYRCKQSPIKEFCNRRACLRKQFGVGETGGHHIEISNITKFEGDPVIWFVEVGGHRLQMSTQELQFQARFHKICIEKLNMFPDEMPKKRWGRYIHEKLQSADVLAAPEEGATTQGQFNILLNMFLGGVGQLVEKDELTSRFAPYKAEEGLFWFRLQGLTDYLDTHGFRYGSTHHVCHMLRERGAETEFKNIKKQGFNVWIIEFNEQDENIDLPDFGKDEF